MRLGRLWIVLVVLFALGAVRAQDDVRYLLPGVEAHPGDGAVTLLGPGGSATYIDGIGWLEGIAAAPPNVLPSGVAGDLTLARALGLDLPYVRAVRFGASDAGVRIVLDVEGTLDPQRLGRVDTAGRASADGNAEARLDVDLPPLLLPLEPPPPFGRVRVTTTLSSNGTPRLEVRGPSFDFDVFTLVEPLRLVVDVHASTAATAVPATGAAGRGSEAGPTDVTAPGAPRTVAPGITYTTRRVDTPVGPTTVHVVEIAPGAAELRVVGESGRDADLSTLASGGTVAINAGYFDPDASEPIGLLRVAGAWLGFPTRGRAAVAFGDGGTTIDRVRAELDVSVDDLRVRAPEDALRLSHASNRFVGRADQGVIRVAGDPTSGRVVGNTVGPAQVPSSGAALIYDPSLRDLARADRGEPITIDVAVAPDAFGRAPYAVEAGPLLVKHGAPAFEPELEGFARGVRILDAYTQQSALGVRADGTTLLVVAERMRAEDLVAVFLDLGADAAMRLDSGSSAGLIVDDTLVNASTSRRVVTAIVAIPRATDPSAEIAPDAPR